MMSGVAFDKIDLSLIRTFHTVITERSVSRAALRLSSSQPAVSGQLKRLRGLIGDPLLVRAGAGMAPTAVALSLLPAAAQKYGLVEDIEIGPDGCVGIAPFERPGLGARIDFDLIRDKTITVLR